MDHSRHHRHHRHHPQCQPRGRPQTRTDLPHRWLWWSCRSAWSPVPRWAAPAARALSEAASPRSSSSTREPSLAARGASRRAVTCGHVQHSTASRRGQARQPRQSGPAPARPHPSALCAPNHPHPQPQLRVCRQLPRLGRLWVGRQPAPGRHAGAAGTEGARELLRERLRGLEGLDGEPPRAAQAGGTCAASAAGSLSPSLRLTAPSLPAAKLPLPIANRPRRLSASTRST